MICGRMNLLSALKCCTREWPTASGHSFTLSDRVAGLIASRYRGRLAERGLQSVGIRLHEVGVGGGCTSGYVERDRDQILQPAAAAGNDDGIDAGGVLLPTLTVRVEVPLPGAEMVCGLKWRWYRWERRWRTD